MPKKQNKSKLQKRLYKNINKQKTIKQSSLSRQSIGNKSNCKT